MSNGLTIKQAAALMNVSERLVYMARKIQRSGRQDLIDAIWSGKMLVRAAIQALGARPHRKDGLRSLVRAWNTATVAERLAFAKAVAELESASVELQICRPNIHSGPAP